VSAPRRRLAVLGSPIAHSLSPRLHAAAYAELGLDHEYGAIELTGDALPGFLDGLDASWRGLSLTMPLKRDVVPLLDDPHPLVEETGVANTVVLDSGVRSGFNTDVHGIVAALADAGLTTARTAILLGAGATARSALAALQGLGVGRFTVAVRDPARADDLVAQALAAGVEVELTGLGGLDAHPAVDVVVSTLPNGVERVVELPMAVRTHAVVLDVAYDPWPTPLAASVEAVGGRVAPGLAMLLHQAVAQVRVFAGGPVDVPLPGEARVEAAMRSAVGLPPRG
jgi:shikimate dehydrogenase